MAFLDDVIGVFSPKTKMKRLQYKRATEVLQTRKYEGAARTRRTQNWITPTSSANTETAAAIETLRNRSRDLVRNNPYAARSLQLIAGNVVGKGIMPDIQSPSETLTDRHNLLWREWAETTACDYACKHNFYGLQYLVMRSVVESGEVLVRKRRVPAQAGTIPVKLQIIEADHLVTSRIYVNSDNGNRVIQGVEIDENDCPVAYHLYENHPGSMALESNKGVSSQYKIVRVPAEDVLHIFRQDRPGQLRGVPWISNSIIRLKELDEFEDAMLVRQKIAACFGAFIYDIEPPPLTPGNTEDGFELEKLAPGIVEYLPPGKDIKFGTPPLPAADTYGQFVSNTLHSVASGLGITYEGLTGDLSQVNFSSARMGWLEFDRNISAWRSHMLDPQFNFSAFQWFREAAMLMGENMARTTVAWTAPRREMIDPTKEVPAKIKAVRAGLETLSDAIRQTGKHPLKHFEDIKRDNDIIDQLKLVLDTDPRKVTSGGIVQSEQQGQNEQV